MSTLLIIYILAILEFINLKVISRQSSVLFYYKYLLHIFLFKMITECID